MEELESIVVFKGIDVDESAVLYRISIASYKLGALDLRKKKHSRVLYSARHLERYTHLALDAPYEDIYPQMLAPPWRR